jgi:hypothetical protein
MVHIFSRINVVCGEALNLSSFGGGSSGGTL